MARHPTTMEPDYFETMFRGTKDPWELETSVYEQAKFAGTIEALSGRSYLHGFEVGCAKGMLTLKLAALCSSLFSIDVSETALAAACQRMGSFDHVVFEKMAFPRKAPNGGFDLVVLSEVAYYWDDADLERAADWLSTHIVPGGDLLLVHFTGETDYPQSGDDAVGKLFGRLGRSLSVIAALQRPLYRLDLWRRPR